MVEASGAEREAPEMQARVLYWRSQNTSIFTGSCTCGTGDAHRAPSAPETTPYFSILSPPLDPLLMSIRSAPSSWATPSRTSRPRRARGCRGGLGGALGERPRSAVLLLLLSSVSGAPVSGSDSAARQEAIDSLVARSSLVELQISGSRTGLVYRVGVEGCLPLRQSGPPRTLYLVAWSLGHTILPPRIQLHPPIGREQFTGAAPLMRSMATTTLTSRCPAPRSSCATCKGRGFRRASTTLSCASRTSRARSGGAWHRRPCGAPPP